MLNGKRSFRKVERDWCKHTHTDRHQTSDVPRRTSTEHQLDVDHCYCWVRSFELKCIRWVS